MKNNTNYDSKKAKKEAKALENEWHGFMYPEAHRLYPANDQMKERLIYVLLNWSQDENNVEMNKFFIEFRMSRITFRKWCIKHPDLMEAYQQAKINLAAHRRDGAMKRKYDSKAVYHDIALLDQDEIELMKLKQEFARKDEPTPSQIVINVPDPDVVTKNDMKKGKDDN